MDERTMKEEELERKAVEELLKEAKRGKDRAETMGAMGWMKCPLASTNKRFLINTIKNTLPPDREKDSRSDDEKDTRSHSGERRHSEKHSSHPYKRSEDSRKDKRRSPPSSNSTRHRQSRSDSDRR
ncbi:protein POLR1D [Bufo bufo]|uniref:protein POLR1D n=1 Tax=Bufo bufo TaxID=8384 RepID=UPI001ABE027A|nr:protein POLR1D [Bufo bufo]